MRNAVTSGACAAGEGVRIRIAEPDEMHGDDAVPTWNGATVGGRVVAGVGQLPDAQADMELTPAGGSTTVWEAVRCSISLDVDDCCENGPGKDGLNKGDRGGDAVAELHPLARSCSTAPPPLLIPAVSIGGISIDGRAAAGDPQDSGACHAKDLTGIWA